jgi:uncharacterized membrane protein HdeD (DUF308 family)
MLTLVLRCEPGSPFATHVALDILVGWDANLDGLIRIGYAHVPKGFWYRFKQVLNRQNAALAGCGITIRIETPVQAAVKQVEALYHTG